MLPKCWFDGEKCARGIGALKFYRAELDEQRGGSSGRPLLKASPVHDWTSHAADAFRYLAMTLDGVTWVRNFNRSLSYPPLTVV
jgi:phage terminase large subunit